MNSLHKVLHIQLLKNVEYTQATCANLLQEKSKSHSFICLFDAVILKRWHVETQVLTILQET